MNEPALRVLVAVRDSRAAQTIQSALQAEGFAVEQTTVDSLGLSAVVEEGSALVIEACNEQHAPSQSLRGTPPFVHDLRNRLAAVRNATYLLKRKMPGEEAKCREYVEIIERELVAAEKILADRTRDR